jgi:hypothetical protein
MTIEQLRNDLTELLADRNRPHVERLAVAAAIVSEALRTRGLEATLVGGAAIEFYDPGAYTTSDIDLVVVRQAPNIDLQATLSQVFASLGFSARGRHWVREELFVEVPGIDMPDPTETFSIGPYTLRVVRKEIALGERIVGFKHWRYTGYGAQAIDLIVSLGSELDEALLLSYLRREHAEDAYRVLQNLARSNVPITTALLERELDSLTRG